MVLVRNHCIWNLLALDWHCFFGIGIDVFILLLEFHYFIPFVGFIMPIVLLTFVRLG